MGYTGRLNTNPVKLSDDIEIRSGTSSTAEAISNEYKDTLGYEPGVGSMYQSTSGVIFVHHRSGNDAVNWSAITDVPQGELEAFTASLSLASSITKDLARALTATTTLSASITSSLNGA